MSTILPESFEKRSFVYRKLTGAIFNEAAGGAMATSFGKNCELAVKPGLLDLSVLPRKGYRGLRAEEHIKSMGLSVPNKPNFATQSDNGELVLRLSQKEFWVLASLYDQGEAIESLAQQELPESDCYTLYNQDSHAWFAMMGPHLPEIMAKVCGVDLRKVDFPVGAIVQTSAARINVVIVHHELKGVPSFSILCDSAAAEYLWDSLLDAMNEFDGEVVGMPV